jgi:PadR family transcriptional regulator, regulatory protein PadR
MTPECRALEDELQVRLRGRHLIRELGIDELLLQRLIEAMQRERAGSRVPHGAGSPLRRAPARGNWPPQPDPAPLARNTSAAAQFRHCRNSRAALSRAHGQHRPGGGWNVSLGELQHLVMLAVVRLRDDAYGAAIRDELRRVAGRSVSVQTVWVTLVRLEEQGLTASGEVAAPEGGRPRRVFRLTPAGWQALEEARLSIAQMWEGVVRP